MIHHNLDGIERKIGVFFPVSKNYVFDMVDTEHMSFMRVYTHLAVRSIEVVALQ